MKKKRATMKNYLFKSQAKSNNTIMATKKKEESKKEVKAFDISMLKAGMAKAGFKLENLEEKDFGPPSEWIHTGSYILNAQLSGSIFGGIPNTRITEFAGDPGTGKTFVCLNLVREAQRLGYTVIYIDTEGALPEKTDMVNIGVDFNKFIPETEIYTVAKLSNYVVNLIEQCEKLRDQGVQPKILIIVDSVGMLTTDKELEDTVKGHDASDMGLKAKQLKKFFTLTVRRLCSLSIPMVFTNHVYSGGMYEAKKASGGQGHIFAASSILFFSKSHLKNDSEDEKKKTGIVAHSTPHKTRFAQPTNVDFYIEFKKGMNPFIGLEEYLSWEVCGIEKGKIFTQKDFEKEAAKSKIPESHPFTHVNKETGEVRDLVFVPASSGRWCIKHMGKSIPSESLLFNREVFTKEVLTELDEKGIQPNFKYPDTTRMFDEELFAPDLEEEEVAND
jgi:RecA/RadA recombinase